MDHPHNHSPHCCQQQTSLLHPLLTLFFLLFFIASFLSVSAYFLRISLLFFFYLLTDPSTDRPTDRHRYRQRQTGCLPAIALSTARNQLLFIHFQLRFLLPFILFLSYSAVSTLFFSTFCAVLCCNSYRHRTRHRRSSPPFISSCFILHVLPPYLPPPSPAPPHPLCTFAPLQRTDPGGLPPRTYIQTYIQIHRQIRRHRHRHRRITPYS